MCPISYGVTLHQSGKNIQVTNTSLFGPFVSYEENEVLWIRPLYYILQTSYILFTNLRTFYKLLYIILQTSVIHLTNFCNTSYKLLINFIQTSLLHLTNFLWIYYKLFTHFLLIFYNSFCGNHKNMSWTSCRLPMNILLSSSDHFYHCYIHVDFWQL